MAKKGQIVSQYMERVSARLFDNYISTVKGYVGKRPDGIRGMPSFALASLLCLGLLVSCGKHFGSGGMALPSDPPAHIVYHVPDSLNVDVDSVAYLRMSFSDVQSILRDKSLPEAPTGIDSVRLAGTTLVRVELSDPTGDYFKIKSERDPQKDYLVDSSWVGEWRWHITPLEDGDHELVLTISTVVKEADRTGMRTEVPYRKSIKVHATPWQNLTKRVSKAWPVALPILTLLVSIIGLVMKKKGKG